VSVLLRGVLIYGEAPETDVLIDDGQIVAIGSDDSLDRLAKLVGC